MAGNIIVDASELEQLISNMKNLSGMGASEIMDKLINTAGNETLRKVKPRTPKDTGNLRRNWNWNNTKKRKTGGSRYEIKLFNPVEYAEYVEFGHRTKGGTRWVPGQFFMKSASEEMQRQLPAMLKKKLKTMVRRALDV